MRVNADFSKRVLVKDKENPWKPSPIEGVERKLLDRIGEEVARATSLVRYAKGSKFSKHSHDLGEEFLVLEGIFQDEHGDYPVGSYIRNPPSSSHTPSSDPGCIIFVKLRQFQLEDRIHIRTHIDRIPKIKDAKLSGVLVTPLYQDEFESVQVESWSSLSENQRDFSNGAEILVLKGEIELDGKILSRFDWMRFPRKSKVTFKAKEKEATIWIKTDHLKK